MKNNCKTLLFVLSLMVNTRCLGTINDKNMLNEKDSKNIVEKPKSSIKTNYLGKLNIKPKNNYSNLKLLGILFISFVKQGQAAICPIKTDSISLGGSHTCALSTNGTVKCWGENWDGQLGYGDTNNRGDNPNEMGNNLPIVNLGTNFLVKQIDSGFLHTCALSTNGTVKCWGSNWDGQLGYGDTNNRGDNPNEMGDILPMVNLGTNFLVKQIALGYYHTCVLSTNSTVKCWGDSTYGQLGHGDISSRGDNSNEMGDDLPTIDLGISFSIKQIYGGGFHTCALSTNGTVKCWGSNWDGQLGYGDTNNRGDNPNEMGNNLPIVNLGTNFLVKQISTQGYHTCALSTNRTVKCWGENWVGHLGYGDTNNRGDNPNEMGNNLPTVSLGTNFLVKQIDGGDAHTCALSTNSTVKCWGGNGGGLGYGDTDNRGDNPNEMGDNLPIVDLGTYCPSQSPTKTPTSNPTTLSPTTSNPTTLSPTTLYPTTSNPTTLSPTTSNPTTLSPTTSNPTTLSPTTSNPTTLSPTTLYPTTSNPTTLSPTTSNPTTLNPTTSNPTTSNPTTLDPTTSNPTTSNPTTLDPTTSNPTTLSPTTLDPTTLSPTPSPFLVQFNSTSVITFDNDVDTLPINKKKDELIYILTYLGFGMFLLLLCGIIIYCVAKKIKKNQEQKINKTENKGIEMIGMSSISSITNFSDIAKSKTKDDEVYRYNKNQGSKRQNDLYSDEAINNISIYNEIVNRKTISLDNIKNEIVCHRQTKENQSIGSSFTRNEGVIYSERKSYQDGDIDDIQLENVKNYNKNITYFGMGNNIIKDQDQNVNGNEGIVRKISVYNRNNKNLDEGVIQKINTYGGNNNIENLDKEVIQEINTCDGNNNIENLDEELVQEINHTIQ